MKDNDICDDCANRSSCEIDSSVRPKECCNYFSKRDFVQAFVTLLNACTKKEGFEKAGDAG